MEGCGTILVIDHDERTRSAVGHAARRLGLRVVSLSGADELADWLETGSPTFAVVEVDLPGETNGLELLQELRERFGDDLPVVLVSATRMSRFDRIAGFLVGADDYLAKPVDGGELYARLRRSLRRNGASTTNGSSPPPPDVGLSPREREILVLLANGKTQDQIAAQLVISPKTVATHIQRLLGKLDVHSRAQAVTRAFQLGLVERPDVDGHALAVELAAPE